MKWCKIYTGGDAHDAHTEKAGAVARARHPDERLRGSGSRRREDVRVWWPTGRGSHKQHAHCRRPVRDWQVSRDVGSW